MEEPDPVLVRAAAEGDLDAFDALVRLYQQPVWRFLCHLVADPALAEDLAQETFLRAYRNLGTFAHQSRPSPEAGAELEAGLAALSPKLREALLVVEVLGYRYREAAIILGVPEGTVKSRVHQARVRLVDWMDDEADDAGRAAR